MNTGYTHPSLRRSRRCQNDKKRGLIFHNSPSVMTENFMYREREREISFSLVVRAEDVIRRLVRVLFCTLSWEDGLMEIDENAHGRLKGGRIISKFFFFVLSLFF